MFKINCVSNNQTVKYAAEELEKYLSILKLEAEVDIGIYSELGLQTTVNDCAFDDEIIINIENGKGFISGSNPRSVLFSVYRYLEKCGITWARPGDKGVFLPEKPILADVKIRETAAMRYRCVCIEGACSIENVLDMVEWLPKLGFNAYHLQFMNSFTFFDRWYSHRNSTVKKPEPFSEEKAYEYVGMVEKEIKKRGLLYIAIGHGWTCEPFGVRGDSWDPVDVSTLPENYLKYTAMINGKRTVYKNLPINTQMCYSNPELRKIMVDFFVDYAEKHPQMDIISLALADDFNNTCECEECTKLRFSDYNYILLNEIDAKLTEKGLNTKVVFPVYCNLLHPPVHERLNNPDRFIIEFAPISRTYCEVLPDKINQTEIPEYTVNKLIMPHNIDENLAYLYHTKQIHKGEIFDFDYHLMWDHNLDAGQEGIAKIINQDVKNLEKLGLAGLVSCQMQRVFFPTSIAMTVMGKTLWNLDTEFDDVKSALYKGIFDSESDKMSEYLEKLSVAFDIGVLRSQKPFEKEVARQNLENAIKMMDEFKDFFAEKLTLTDDSHDLWKHFQIHREIYTLVAESALAKLDGNMELASIKHKAAGQVCWENEDILQPVADCMHLASVTGYRIKMDGERSKFLGT